LAWISGDRSLLEPAAILNRIHHDAGFDPRHEVLVSDLPTLHIADFDAGTVTAQWQGSDAIAATVASASGGFRVFSVNDMNGWTASVDGQAQPIHRADYSLFGLTVPAGRHEVRLQYRMPVWIWALPAGAALLGLLAIFRLGRNSVVRGNRN
jgi:hypothetical protein